MTRTQSTTAGVGASATVPRVLPSLTLAFRNRFALLAAITEDDALFVRGHCDLAVGLEVALELQLDVEHLQMECPGRVAWKRLRGTPRLPSGVGIRFCDAPRDPCHRLRPDDGQPASLQPLHCRSHRVYVAITCRYYWQSTWHQAVTTNLSCTGALLQLGHPPPLGERIYLRLYPPGDCALDLVAEVVRLQHNPCEAVGLRFIGLQSQARQRLDQLWQLLNRLAASGEAPRM